jgi:iron(III) transport system substrate-binding protein
MTIVNRERNMRSYRVARITGRIVTAAAALAFVTSSALADTELTVYTAVEAEDLKRYAEAFNEDHPDITIKWVRDSTGIVTNKLLAEKDNPQADVIWGLAATSLMLMKNEGMLEAYAPGGLDMLDKNFRDADNPPYWTGMDAWVAAVCVNTVEAEKHGLPMPTSWEDLTKPVYKGHLAMPNPGSSGTGFLDVSSWLQIFGEEGGWAFMDRLHENIDHYTHSGSKPCRRNSHRYLLCLPWREIESARGAPRDHHPQGRDRLGHGGDRDRRGNRQAGGRAKAGRLVD